MGLFSGRFTKPGPGVPKDMPRKTGMARFVELLLRDFADFVKLSLLFSLVALPSVLVFILGTLPFMLGYFEMNLLLILLSLALAYPIGGAMVACYFNITRLMRDDASYVWHDFKRKFKENHRQAAPVGMVTTAFVYMQVLIWFQMYYQMVEGLYTGGLLWAVLAVLSLILYFMIIPYVFMHFSYIELGTFQVLKNSLLMSFAFLPRSFMGALCGNIMWMLFALFMPNSMVLMPFVPLILMSLSMLMTLSWVWPKFNTFHNIEETLKKMREENNNNGVYEKEDTLSGVSSDEIFRD